MTITRIKLIAITLFVLPVLALSIFFQVTPGAAVTAAPDDTEAVYKAKCAMCHSPKAEKAYDPAMPIDQQVEAILKGKKAEKPPHMPAFEAKGITAEQAKALAEYMQGLRKPAQ